MHYTMHAIEHAQNNNTGCYKDGVYNDCNDSVFDNVSKPHGWRVVFRYGTVTGTSVCSTTGSALNIANANQDIYDINTPDTTSEGGAYCWCKALKLFYRVANSFLRVDIPQKMQYQENNRQPCLISWCLQYCNQKLSP